MGNKIPLIFPAVMAGGAAVPWYLSGGVAAANCIAAYKAIGAASVAESQVNLANPGTYDLTVVGTTPVFSNAVGWTFSTAAKYWNTGIDPAANATKTWTIIARYSGIAGNTGLIMGVTNGTQYLGLAPNRSGDIRRYYNSNNFAIATATTAGVMAIAGLYGFMNGTNEIGGLITWADCDLPSIFIGAINNNGGGYALSFEGSVQAVAIYDTVLTDEQVGAVSAAMSFFSPTYSNPYAVSKSSSYNVQLHCHTTGSDGADTPTEVMTAYKAAGYDAVAITDHDVITADPGVAGITHIPGCEETVTGGHMPCLWLTARETSATNQTVINTINSQGGMCEFAHPDYGGADWSTSEMAALTGISFFEVYNAVVQEVLSGDGYCEVQWDTLLTAGRVWYGLAVDDCHDITSAAFNCGWVIVHANSIDDIKASLAAGNFYATQGPDVTVTFDGTTITAITTDAATIDFIKTGGAVAQTKANAINDSYAIDPADRYIRVKIMRDSDSKIAWSQPISWLP